MGLQRFPYEKFKGLNLRDAPYDLDPSESYDCQNVCPLNYEDLTGITQRQGLVPYVPSNYVPNLPLGDAFGQGNYFKDLIPFNKRDLYVFTWRSQVWSTVSALPGIIYDPGGTAFKDGQYSYAVANDAGGAEKLWITPTYNGTATALAQKWDGVAATTTAWANTPPNLLAGVAGSPVTYRGGNMWWRGRMLIWGVPTLKNRLYFSDKNNPESPAGAYGNNFIDFPDTFTYISQGLTGALPHQESVIIFKERGIWQVISPSTFENRRIDVSVGCGWPRCAISHPNGRFYFLDPASNQLYSATLRGDLAVESDKVRGPFASMRAGMGVNDNLTLGPRQQIIVCVGSYNPGPGNPGGIGSGPMKVYEFIPGKPGEGAWFPHNYGGETQVLIAHKEVAGAVFMTMQSHRALYYAFLPHRDWVNSGFNSLTDGIPIVASPFSVGTTNINAYWRSSWRPFLSEEPLERLRRVHAIYGGTATLETHSKQRPLVDPSTISGGSNSYTLPEVTNVDDRDFSLNRPESRGRYHQFVLRSVAAKSFEVDKLEFAFRGGKEHA